MISPTVWHSRRAALPGAGEGGWGKGLQQALDLDLRRELHPVWLAEPEEPLQ